MATIDAQRLQGAATVAGTVAERLGGLDPSRVRILRDSRWAVNSLHTYTTLVDRQGWPVDRCRDWLGDVLVALIPAAVAVD